LFHGNLYAVAGEQQVGSAVRIPGHMSDMRTVSRRCGCACEPWDVSCGWSACHTAHTRTTAVQCEFSYAPVDDQLACSTCRTVNQSVS